MTSSGVLSDGGLYPSGSLEVVRSTDEDGHVRLSFLDKQGRTLLDRGVLSGDSYADTYYVYDSRGLLRHVLTPAMGSDFSSSSLASSGYSYSYDGLGRLTCGRRPGCGETFYEYDAMDRLVFSQDGVQRASGRWSYYLYDAFGRLTEEGECTVKSPLGGKTVHVRHLYDSYGFLGTEGFTGGVYPAATVSGQGKLTGRVSLATDGSGTAQNLYTAYYYDTRGRVTQAVQSNLLGGHDVTHTVYTFTGKPAVVSHTHTASGKPTLTEVTTYTYDHAERLTKVEHTLGGVKVTLVSNTYDELGRLQSKTPHGNTSLAQSYTYNIRDWLTGIDGKFTQTLQYNDGATPCYNGNISGMTWKAGNETTTHSYKFTYDNLNRMQDAIYSDGTNADRFTEKVTSYDKNGNILGLHRYGQTGASSYGLIDNLTFTLNGNQLNRVDDAVTASAYNNGFEFKDAVKQANEYTYDANGNLTKDLNRNISNIQYNFLNLPGKVTFGDGSTIEYVYAADGTKLRTKHVINGTTTTTDYCGNVVYENGVQKLLLTEAGYVTLSDRKYHYYLQDHQGNNRVVLNQDGTVEEVNHYYPFGGLFASSTSVQPYKYNGKELDTENGLNWYDYGARMYDPALGRFMTVDPSSESYYETSPYAYCYNNPIKHIDPNGKDGIISIYGDNIVIRANIILTGPYATSQLAGIYKAGIMATWGKQTTYEYQDKTYNLQWDIKVYANKDEEPNFNGVNNYMEVKMDPETTSKVKYTNQGFLRGEGRNGFNIRDDNSAPHEFGHIIGLADKYIKNGPQKDQPVDDSWSNNIMGAWNGKVEKKNLDILLTQPIELHEFLMKWNKDVPWVDYMKTTYYINDKNREPK